MIPEEPYDVISDLKAFIEDIARFPNDDTFRFETDRTGAKAILAAIRAAENDALERAAEILDEHTRISQSNFDEYGESAWAGAVRATTEAASAVRALKHKDAE